MGIFAWLSSEHIHHLDVNWGEVLVALGLVATAVPLTASVRLLPQSDFFNCRHRPLHSWNGVFNSQTGTPAKKSSKNLPNHPTQFVTLEIENRKQTSHKRWRFFIFGDRVPHISQRCGVTAAATAR
jgi:hypothetical protein